MNNKKKTTLKLCDGFYKYFAEQWVAALNKDIEDVNERFEIMTINSNKLELRLRRKIITIDLEKVREFFCENKNKSEFPNMIEKYIDLFKSQKHIEIIKNKIFPMIKTGEFFKEKNNKGYYKKSVGADLYAIYVDEFEGQYEALTLDDVFDKLEYFADKNLDKIDGDFVKIDDVSDKYILYVESIYNASMILNKRIQQQAIDLCGEDFIFIIPDRRTLLIAPNTQQYQKELSYFANIITDDVNISTKVYSFKNGCITEKEFGYSRQNNKSEKRIPKYIKIIK